MCLKSSAEVNKQMGLKLFRAYAPPSKRSEVHKLFVCTLSDRDTGLACL